MSDLNLLKLLTLSSTALPVGAYCYSQGLESAIEQGLITDEHSGLSLMHDVVELVLGRYELPMLYQLIQANDADAFQDLAQCYAASRETRELLAETRQMAYSLQRWLAELDDCAKMVQVPDARYGFLPTYAACVRHWQLDAHAALQAYGFTYLENQVLALVKTVPLGQMAGQRILWQLHEPLNRCIEQVAQQTVSSSLPGLACLSTQHERQYSRLFRS